MDSKSMEKAMLENMVKKTGRSIQDWAIIIEKQKHSNNKDIIQFLKEQHSIGHFYAHLIVKKIK